MTSSTSSSDRSRGRWLAAFAWAFFGLGGVLFALVLLIDPYDTGRFPGFGIVGIEDRNPRTASISRGRDPRFDAAIVANSTGQLLQPSRLDPATGYRFIQLSIPQTGPREQLAIMRWIAAHHHPPGAFVLVADELWCSADPKVNLRYPFPFWLYGDDAAYLANIMNWHTFDRAASRLKVAFGLRPASDPVGYSDYSAQSKDAFRELPPDPPKLTDAQAAAPFPWVDALGSFVARLDPATAFVIVMPPVQTSYLPQPGTPAAARWVRCKAALARTVAGRTRSGFLDFRTDTAETQDMGNFFDRVHYKNPVAREIEDRIIATLRPAPTASR